MNTKDLVEKLTAKFGEIEAVRIGVIERRENEDETIEITSVIKVLTRDNKVACGMEVINIRCSFKNGIYSNIPVGMAIHDAIMNRPNIYTFYSDKAGIAYLIVPCEIGDIDIDKFTIVANLGEACPYKGTEKCPLHRYKANQEKEEKTRIPIII